MNLKGLVHYEQKKYAKALDSVEKAIESEPTFGMAWYNKACFLSLINQIPESLEALIRSIEIDVKNARKAVKDKDFVNVRIEEGFKRIVEVVVLESIKQGYHTIGAIVWTTFLDKADALDALAKLVEKGLIVKHLKNQGFNKIPIGSIALLTSSPISSWPPSSKKVASAAMPSAPPAKAPASFSVTIPGDANLATSW